MLSSKLPRRGKAIQSSVQLSEKSPGWRTATSPVQPRIITQLANVCFRPVQLLRTRP